MEIDPVETEKDQGTEEAMNQTSAVAVGQCIYCRALPTADDRLSDEHILPFGIYGKQKVKKASCRRCAAITSAFEGKAMQDLASVREVIGFPTRHEKRKKDLKLLLEIVTTEDEVKTIDVSTDEYYPMIALPAFNPPAYVSKNIYVSGIEMIGHSTAPGSRSKYQDRLDKLRREHNAKEIAIYTLKWPTEWARMFAKAAYVLAVRDYGLERFKREDVYVLDAILGKRDDVGMWVGCIDQVEPVYGDEYDDQVVGLWEKEGEVHAVIKLFAFLNSVPEYQVIVARLS
jgi:hypothetical protein